MLCCKLKRSKWDLWLQKYFYLRTWTHLHLEMDGHFQGEYISMVRTVKCLFHRVSLCFQMVAQGKNLVIAIFLCYYCRYIWLTRHLISDPKSRLFIFHLMRINFIDPIRYAEGEKSSIMQLPGLKRRNSSDEESFHFLAHQYIPKIWTMLTLLVWDLWHMINLYMLPHNCMQAYKWE